MFFTGFKVAVKLKFIVSRNGRSTTRNGDFIGKDWNAKITGYFYIKLQARQEQRMCLLLVGLIFSTTEPLVLNHFLPIYQPFPFLIQFHSQSNSFSLVCLERFKILVCDDLFLCSSHSTVVSLF